MPFPHMPFPRMPFPSNVSQTTDYIRAKICFNLEKPAIEAKNLIISQEEVVVIRYEYKKIHKRCFSCMRLTHEKTQYPYMRKGESSKEGDALIIPQKPTRMAAIEAPQRFLTMFPELSREDRQAAMQYISQADETESIARIVRVQQSIENATTEDNGVPIRISHDLHKDKGLVLECDQTKVYLLLTLESRVFLNMETGQENSLKRGRFYFDKRMYGKRGVEEAIVRGWEAENDSPNLTVLERIVRCRTELAKLKK
ncbi:hypothetical protein HID58_079912, partial [Brassica napus]